MMQKYFRLSIFCLAGLVCCLPGLAVNVNNDFDITATRETGANVLIIKLQPNPDRQINGLSARHPFITLTAPGMEFAEGGEIFREEYITPAAPATFHIGFAPEKENFDLGLRLHYVACSISQGVCDMPRVEKLTFPIAKPRAISGVLVRTLLLGGLCLLAVVALVLYIRFRKQALFTGILLLACGGLLFFSFTEPVFGGRTQAALSHDIAATLCLSCIGLEGAFTELIVSPQKTSGYAELPEPVKITLFSAPWCGSCKTAKAYLDKLVALYPDRLQYQVIDIATEDGKAQYDTYAATYAFQNPLPLPAVIVSADTSAVLYGAGQLEDRLLEVILD